MLIKKYPILYDGILDKEWGGGSVNLILGEYKTPGLHFVSPGLLFE